MHEFKTQLGHPLPNSLHAVSVSLPKWADVVGYEEGEKRVVDAMKLGYPRFVYHPLVKQLFAEAEAEFAKVGEFCMVLPSKKVAEQCVEFCKAGKVNEFKGVFAVVLQEALRAKAKEFWQHAGFIISSRQAEAILNGNKPIAEDFQPKIKAHLAKIAVADAEDIYLFPTGMAAIFAAYQLLNVTSPSDSEGKAIEADWPARPRSASNTIQLGFPYLDTLKIQQKWGANEFVRFNDFETLSKAKTEAIFTEFPLNPLLQQVDFVKLREVIGETPLIIDDTLSTWENFRSLDYADIAVTSLTKFYSGIGDVTAGSLILSKKSPHYARFKAALAEQHENLLYPDDAEVLWKNAQGYKERIAKINVNAAKIADFLKTRHPSLETRHYGGMISVIMPKPEQAVKFYDSLEVSKGPSLGTEYTLACPYTLLAHYKELDWAASLGVPAHLVRISIGCEDYAELEDTFEKALQSAQ